jgi:hypothetical protein
MVKLENLVWHCESCKTPLSCYVFGVCGAMHQLGVDYVDARLEHGWSMVGAWLRFVWVL